jgi:hypothetical protein
LFLGDSRKKLGISGLKPEPFLSELKPFPSGPELFPGEHEPFHCEPEPSISEGGSSSSKTDNFTIFLGRSGSKPGGRTNRKEIYSKIDESL